MKFLQLTAAAGLLLLYSHKANSQSGSHYPLNFDPKHYKPQTLTVEGKEIKVRAYEDIVYVAKPVDIIYQKLNIYIPEAYFNGESINGYTAASAPIFFPNNIGGYMPAVAAAATTIGKGGFPGGGGPGGMPPGGGAPGGMPPGGGGPDGMPPGGAPPEGGFPGGDRKPGDAQGGMPAGGPGGGGMGSRKPSALLVALSKGYIVASAGARGRTTKDKSGTYTGKAPAAIVDLKAAIRYLKFNDKVMPGDAGKIISNGTSAGGAMSALLGGTGNAADYEPYLKALGAAEASDDIFAVSAYCPITNLDHADMAYEWQFNNIHTYEKRSMRPSADNSGSKSSELTQEQIAVSNDLKPQFPAYVNSLHLTGKDGKPLLLDAAGNGSFKELVKAYVMASAQKEVDKGTDLSKHSWLTISNGKVTGIDFEAYVAYMQRMKTPPAFDALDLSAGENQLFGTASEDKLHFTAYATQHSAVKAGIADATVVKMMNPLYYIGQPQVQPAKHWRIRHGSKDKDTGLAISVILATYLQNKGIDTDLALPWDKPHSGDYDLDELFAWTDSICK